MTNQLTRISARRRRVTFSVLLSVFLLAAAIATLTQEYDPFLWVEKPVVSIKAKRGFAFSGAVEAGGDLPGRAKLLEDGRPLDRPGSRLKEIAGGGGGRHSFAGMEILFSSSDGSDPDANGRSYTVRLPRKLPLPRPAILLLLSFAAALLARFSPASSPGENVRRMISPWLIGGAFAASLFTFSSILARSFPPGNPTIFDRKITQFSAAGEEAFNTVFVGSSRVYRHIIPAVFDSTTALAGLGIRSYNCGYYGTRALELPHLMRRVLAADRKRNLKWVFVDIEPMAWDLEDVNFATARVASYHDIFTLGRAARYAVSRDSLPRMSRIGAAARHVIPFSRHLFSWSEGSAWLKNVIRPRGNWQRRHEELWEAHRNGYLSLESSLELSDGEERGRLEERRSLFMKKRKTFVRNVRGLRFEPPTAGDLGDVMIDILTRIDRMVREHGAVPLIISNPIVRPRNDLRIAFETGVIENFFPFDDPDSCAVLFNPDSRFDEGHLNSEGAIIYTTLLADRFARWLDANENSGGGKRGAAR